MVQIYGRISQFSTSNSNFFNLGKSKIYFTVIILRSTSSISLWRVAALSTILLLIPSSVHTRVVAPLPPGGVHIRAPGSLAVKSKSARDLIFSLKETYCWVQVET